MNCIAPFRKDGMDFPCGKCYYCLRRRTSGWSFRLMKEERVSLSSFFVTLTYKTEYVPITPRGYMSLNKSHIPELMRTIRQYYRYRAVNPKTGRTKWYYDKVPKIRYFAVGEYGGKTDRPHYHVLFFNVNIDDVEKAWYHGAIHVGRVSEASTGYTLKYMMKPGKVPLHKNDDRLPEFQLMSKGLGANYLTKESIAWHKADFQKTEHGIFTERMYLPLYDGKKIAMPRYYKEKIYSKLQRELIGNQMRNVPLEEKDLTAKEEIIRFEHSQVKLKKSRIDETF